jgi:hypothetical protein
MSGAEKSLENLEAKATDIASTKIATLKRRGQIVEGRMKASRIRAKELGVAGNREEAIKTLQNARVLEVLTSENDDKLFDWERIHQRLVDNCGGENHPYTERQLMDICNGVTESVISDHADLEKIEDFDLEAELDSILLAAGIEPSGNSGSRKLGAFSAEFRASREELLHAIELTEMQDQVPARSIVATDVLQ